MVIFLINIGDLSLQRKSKKLPKKIKKFSKKIKKFSKKIKIFSKKIKIFFKKNQNFFKKNFSKKIKIFFQFFYVPVLSLRSRSREEEESLRLKHLERGAAEDDDIDDVPTMSMAITAWRCPKGKTALLRRKSTVLGLLNEPVSSMALGGFRGQQGLATRSRTSFRVDSSVSFRLGGSRKMKTKRSGTFSDMWRKRISVREGPEVGGKEVEGGNENADGSRSSEKSTTSVRPPKAELFVR